MVVAGLFWAGGACAGAEGRAGARMPVERPPVCRRGILLKRVGVFCCCGKRVWKGSEVGC